MLSSRARLLAGCAAALTGACVYVVFAGTWWGQLVDDRVFGWAQRFAVGPLRQWLPVVCRGPLVAVIAGVTVMIGLVAVWRGRVRSVVCGTLIVAISVTAARFLREVLPRPDHGFSYDVNTLPSTHVAAVTSLVVASILMTSTPRPRWLAWCGALLVWLACVGNVVGYAHRPSDVVASVLLVASVTGAVLALAPLRGHGADTLSPVGSATAAQRQRPPEERRD
ncbi:phosphatase PAP2 family protein [Janibacter indicus]|uniref:phosphatase PAP2 family protein n=1 Tax=Janibacter indicus TaxID=857417 RepID=UPI003EB93B01